ncbi:MAG: hypothetical protein IPI46_11705 [Bacteroidetes bacterium]|nr:hypothetical protein [Bacteroidota bacterium]
MDTVTVTGANGCTSTDAVIVNAIVGSCSTNLTLKLYIEGYYLFSGEMASVLFNQVLSTNVSHADSIHVQLRSTTPPYNVVASTHTILTTTGNATCVFPPSVSGNYYVVIKHRNAIETWSSNGVTVGAIPPYMILAMLFQRPTAIIPHLYRHYQLGMHFLAAI